MTLTSAATDRAPDRKSRDIKAGFTLMEVVLAMLITSMLATLALPYFRPGVGAAVVKAKASEIASLLRRDRNMTLRLGDASMIYVDTKHGVVGSERLRQSVKMPVGVALRVLPEGARSVNFLADGSSSGARIVLASQNASVSIDINRVTAAIRIVEVDR